MALAQNAPVEWQSKFLAAVRSRVEGGLPEELAELQAYAELRGDRYLKAKK